MFNIKMNLKSDEINNSISEFKKKCQYIKENNDEIERKKREEYKKSQKELIQNGIAEIKILKDKNINLTDEEIIKSNIFIIKLISSFARLHTDNYREETVIIMTFVQFCLTLDDKSDNQYTELLEKIFFESLFDKSFIDELISYLSNKKICSFFEDMNEYLKK